MVQLQATLHDDDFLLFYIYTRSTFSDLLNDDTTDNLTTAGRQYFSFLCCWKHGAETNLLSSKSLYRKIISADF